ncbi:hypothetical protein BBJ28_00000556 [Nothophytophthora sp. Chile5]|nr:hypothetical protein BBJ28_00000556 [Nothophytophthora sp. Chile5]
MQISFHCQLRIGGIPILAFMVFWNGQKFDAEGYLESPSQISYLDLTTLISVPHLKPLGSYNVSVVAINSFSLCYFGRATTSQEVTLRTTNYSAPASPRLVTLRTTGGGITLNLIDPYDTGGQDIRQYRLYSKRNGTTEPWRLVYEGPTHQATVARLTSLTDYSFMASVNNGIFDSANSSVKVDRTTSKSAPGACAPVSLVIATGGMIQVSWDYPPDNGGSVITSFYVTIASGLDGSGRTTVLTKLLTYTFYRLIAESEYNVVVRAINVMGAGPESSSATFTTAAESPPVGEIEVAVLESTGGAAAISFAEPIDLGGVKSSDMVYQIYLDRENILNLTYSSLQDNIENNGNARRLEQSTSRWLDVSTTVFSNVLIGDMDPKTLYGVQVRPVNVNNSGELSATFPVETRDPTTPSSPLKVAIEEVTGGLVSLSWKPPVDSGGIPLSGYVLHRANSKDGPIVEASRSTLAEATIYTLSPNTAYWFSVTAWNGIGESLASEALHVSTRSVTPPSTPRELTIQSVSFDGIACNWTTPQDMGGDIIASYSVTATETADPMVSVTLTVEFPSAQFQGLSSSTSYSISVVSTYPNMELLKT